MTTTQIIVPGCDEGEMVKLQFSNVNRWTNKTGLFMEISQDRQNCFIQLTPEVKRYLLGVLLAEIQERKEI